MQYLLPKGNVLPEYLCYVVKYMHLEKYFTGATIPHIYFKDYKNEEFNLDSLDRQKEIVSTLNKIEKVIESRTKELELLDELIRADLSRCLEILMLTKKIGMCTKWSNYVRLDLVSVYIRMIKV